MKKEFGLPSAGGPVERVMHAWKATIVLTEPDDAEILIGERNPEKVAETLLNMGPSMVAFEIG